MSNEEKFDGILLSLAQQMPGGIPELMDTLFSFLGRKTDFYTAPDKAREMVLGAYSKYESRSREQEQKKRKAEEERRRRQKEQEEAEARKPRVVEINDEEEMKIVAEQKEEKSRKGNEEVSNKPKQIAERSTDEEDGGKLLPNVGGGSQTDRYVWTQSLQEIDARVYLPEGTRAKDLNVVIKSTHITVGLKGQQPIIDDDLEKPIKTGDLFWSVEDNKLLIITMTKVNQIEWWPRFLKSEDEIATRKVQPEASRIDELDDESQTVVRKMRFDQDQKEKGLPSSDDLQKHDLLRSFMDKHPEMDFSKAKFS